MTDICSFIRDYLLNCNILDEEHIVLSFENTALDTLISITQTDEESPILTYGSGYAVLRPRVTFRIRSPDRDKTWALVSEISAACHNRTVGGVRMFRLRVRDVGLIRLTTQAVDGGEPMSVESFLVIMEFRCLIPNSI